MGGYRRKKIPGGLFTADIESLSDKGRGVTQINGKTVFIDNALPGERVEFSYTSRRASFDEGVVAHIGNKNEQRIEPECAYFGYCGGCSLQHLSPTAQIQHKQSILLKQFAQLGKLTPEQVLSPLTGPLFGYRHKARLAVKYVRKKEKVLVGFREKRSSFVADIDQCKVLHPAVGGKLQALQTLLQSLSVYNRIPQIEVAVGDNGVALVMRHLANLDDADIKRLSEFERIQKCKFYLQAAGYDSVRPLSEAVDAGLYYKLDDHDIQIGFRPTDFTQINAELNRKLIKLAIDLLRLNEDDAVLDLFCGVGNFTLPAARQSKSVTGVEGVAGLVERAGNNAVKNGIDNVEFHIADLFKVDKPYPFMNKDYDKILLDPARTGAKEIVSVINLNKTNKIVYVSCNPTTLARDAAILVHERGFKLKQAGVIDMFPHTGHVESIALFEKR